MSIEWNGEGLPPVGTRCEWQDKNTKKWMAVTVTYLSEWVTVIREDKDGDAAEIAIENYGDEERINFRPIHTEAEHKRDEAVIHLTDAICMDGNVAVVGQATASVYAGRVIDAIAAGRIPHITLK